MALKRNPRCYEIVKSSWIAADNVRQEGADSDDAVTVVEHYEKRQL